MGEYGQQPTHRHAPEYADTAAPSGLPTRRSNPVSERRTRRRTTVRQHQRIVAVVTLAGIAAATTSAAAPTELWLIDAAYRAAFAALLVVAVSYARRWTWAAIAAGGTLLAAMPWLVVGCLAMIIAAFAISTDRNRVHGALVGALSAQVLLHLEVPGFHGSASVAALLICAPAIISAARILDEDQIRRAKRHLVAVAVIVVVAFASGGLAAAMAAHNVNEGVGQARAGIRIAEDGDHQLAMTRLIDARANLSRASAWLTSPLTIPARAIPIVGQHMRAAQVAAGEGTALATAAEGIGRNIELDDLRPNSGHLDLGAIDAAAAPLERLALTVDRTRLRLDAVDSSWILPQVAGPLDKLRTELKILQPKVDTASLAARQLPDLFGRNGSLDYLVLFTTPAEARGLGGFIGSWATIRADNGQLEMVETGRARDLNTALRSAQATLTAPDDYIDRWSRFTPERHFQDITFSPDFPTVAAVAANLVEQTGRQVDGVFAIDPAGLAALLRLTGPVTLQDGWELTAANAEQFLLFDQYEAFDANAEREELLADAAEAVFAALLESEFPEPGVASDILGDAVARGRIMGWSPMGSDLFVSAGMTGAFPTPHGGDLLAVTHQNSANNKLDVYLDRQIDHVVEYDPLSGDTAATTTITLTNNAPRSGLANGVLGSNDQGLPPGTNRLYLSVYTPLQLQSATLDGAEIGLETQSELEWRVYAGFVQLAPGQTATVELHLTGSLDPGGYDIVVSPQSLAQPDSVHLQVTDPDGRSVVDTDLTPVVDTRIRPGS